MAKYKNLFNIKNKVTIIIGATRGIGKEIAAGFSEFGAITYCIGRTKTKKKNFFSCDINDSDQIEKIFNQIYKRHNKIDILVNCASITSAHSKDYRYNFQKVLNTNLTAHYFVSKIFYKYVNKINGGNIINISSIGSKMGFPNNPAYVSSKFGISGLTKALALDFYKKNIKVNAIVPGYIKTSMTIESYSNKKKRDKRTNRTILKRWGEPSDIVGASIFLASSASNYITGSEVIVDGGWLAKGL